MEESKKEEIAHLVDMGFSREDAVFAFLRVSTIEAAVELLTRE